MLKDITPSKTILPLENGDHLTRYEFERRYHAMPHVKKAELIEGIVYMSSPLRFESHGKPHFSLIGWLATYQAATPGVDGSDNVTVRLDSDNELQPDVLLRLDSRVGGQSYISEDDYIEGAPELICEIAASSASYDLYTKLDVYCRNGVQEYLVWKVYEKAFDWYRLREGEYIKLEPDSDGILKSEIFPGLWLKVEALLKSNLAEVLRVLQLGLSSLEHKEFVTKLTNLMQEH